MSDMLDDLIEGGAELIGDVGSFAADEITAVGQTAYHAGAAVYDGATGDWDGAASQSLSMSESAVNFLTHGAFGTAETAFDAGSGQADGAHDTILGGLKDAGEWLGDEAYNLVNGE